MTYARIITLTLTALAVGCSESHAEPEPDAGITFEPPPPALDAGFDAGFDAGPGIPVGTSCTVDTDCGDGAYCLSEGEGFAGGYCTAPCPTGDECPSGSACVEVGGGMTLCLDSCDPAATERECRSFYGCASGFGIPTPVCIPGCTDDTDCAPGRSCNPAGGGECYNPAAAPYDPCEGSTDCNDGERCSSEYRRGNPGGMCTAFGCDPMADTGCPDDGHCIPGGRSGFGRCIDGCEVDADCRAGYACRAPEAYPDRMVCTPACTADEQCTLTAMCDETTGLCGTP